MTVASIPRLADGPKQQLLDPFIGKKRWMTEGEHELLLANWNARLADSLEDAIPDEATVTGVSIFGVPSTPDEDVVELAEDPEAALSELKNSLLNMRRELSGEQRRASFSRERQLLLTEFKAYQDNYYSTTEQRQKTQFWGRMKLIERRLHLLIEAEEIEKEHPGEVYFGTHRSSDLRFPVPLGEPVQFKNGVLTTSDALVKAKVFQAIKKGKHRGLRTIRQGQRPYFHMESGEFQGWWTEDDVKQSGLNYRRWRRW